MAEWEDASVLLGFVQEVEDPLDTFSSKAGGTPLWLNPTNIPDVSDACCGFCKEPLQFLLQVYVPLSDNKPRTLFVFMCPNMSCLSADLLSGQALKRSVKVFRAQLDHSENHSSEPLSSPVQLCDWCRTWKGGSKCSGCKKTFYCSQKHQVEHWRAEHSSACKSGTQGKTTKKLWREFEIYLDDEREEKDYVTQETLQVGGEEADEFQSFEEGSKEDQVVATFQARIQRDPSQVLRFSSRTRDARPMWMKLEGQCTDRDVRPCQLCGGPRVFEFQVMPQLLYFFGVENDRDSFDWGTIAVYSCLSSCTVQGYVEEFVWVQATP